MRLLPYLLLALFLFSLACVPSEQAGSTNKNATPDVAESIAPSLNPATVHNPSTIQQQQNGRLAATNDTRVFAAGTGAAIAHDPSATQQQQKDLPAATPRGQTQEVADTWEKPALDQDNIKRCLHWSRNKMNQQIFNAFEALDPADMEDIDRALWGGQIRGDYDGVAGSYTIRLKTHAGYDSNTGLTSDSVLRLGKRESEWCQDYWSEALSPNNAGKRNEIYRDSCKVDLVGAAVKYEEDVKRYAFEYEGRRDYDSPNLSAQIVNQYIRLLNWMDLTGEQVMTLDKLPGDIIRDVAAGRPDGYSDYFSTSGSFPSEHSSPSYTQWYRIERAFVDVDDTCANYFPQLFYSRWIPLEPTYAGLSQEEMERQTQDKIKNLRDNKRWRQDLFDQTDRDIMIQLRAPTSLRTE